MCDDHPWSLTAPWWHWPAVGTPNRNVRRLPPALQKYDTSDPVSAFVKEPQKSLLYDDQDRVQTLTLAGPVGTRASYSGGTLTPSGTRKVFLPIHKRFYLVVVELHCDSPGFPSVAREKACEVGMVIRRRQLSVGNEHSAQAVQILKTIGAATARIAEIDRRVQKRVLKKRTQKGFGASLSGNGTGLLTKSKVDVALDAAATAEREKLEGELAAARQQLLAWKSTSGATVLKEGWVASDFENVGSWQVVEEEPQGTSEVIYPLYPLIPDPRDPRHDASGKTIYFGMLPTGTREVEANGKARFDEESRYEVRCFVRRHECECPVATERNDCGGELIWSAPTETFQLAGHFDPHGSGNHPITIQMPDIPALAAAAGDAKLPVAMKFPAGSALNFSVDQEEQKGSNPSTNGFPQICYFSIPLITIIATFVLNLFLPIVVFLFQLWFLLGLKFCILPSISIAVGLDASLQAELDIQLELALELSAEIDVAVGVDLENAIAANMNLAITGDAHADFDAGGNLVLDADFGDTPGKAMADALDTTALVALDAKVTDDRTAEVESRSIVAGMVFQPRVERAEVAA